MEFERERVGAEYANQVIRVSSRNTSAGFDIQSVSVQSDGRALPRFIEVKAVSPRSFLFYWSKREMSVARTLSEWYYLYLLPVSQGDEFDPDRLKMIADPYEAVIQGSSWATEPDGFECKLKLSSDSYT